MPYQAIKTLKGQVEAVLRDVPETRDSDIRLMIEVWMVFYPEFVKEFTGTPHIYLNDLYQLPREDNIKRIRAYFQNVKKLYLPTVWEVARKRGIEENEWRVAMGYPTKETAGTDQPSWTPPSLETTSSQQTTLL